MLTPDHKEQVMYACADLLEWYKTTADFLDSIVNEYETRGHHYEPKPKRQSIEWRRKDSPTKKKVESSAIR
jgi:hypothetical protein